MKHFVLVISIFLIFITFGCAIETPTENQETKVETSSTKVNVGKEMSVHFLDVGQGDSILIQSPEGKNMLIDGGKKDAGKQVVSYLQDQGVDELDYVIATHPDADHIGGLLSVLNSISVKNFVDSGRVHTSQTYEEMLELIGDKKVPFIVPVKGDTIPLDSTMEINVLNAGENSNDNNEASIVLKVQYGKISFLLTGDADIGVENSMLNQYYLESTFLKAGHHGSDTSTSEAFIRAVKPKVTILSYGKDNSYGHPQKEVVNRIKNIKSQVYATAEVGNIIVKTNGVDYTISTQNSPDEQIEETSVSTTPVVISSKDVQEEIVGLTNAGNKAVNLKDWKLVSIEGNQVYTFPNINLSAGKTIYITSGQHAKEGQGYIKWNKGQMWRNEGDPARLVNEKGEIVSEVE